MDAGLDGMALGEHDWWLGADFVRALVEQRELPVLAANLSCGASRPFPAGRVVERGGQRIALVGITTGEVAGCVVEDPRLRAEAALRELGEVDLAVLLAPLAERQLEEWGRAGSDFDLVIAGQSEIPSTTAFPWADGFRVQAGSRGKQLGVATVGFVEGAAGLARREDGERGRHALAVELRALDEEVADEPAAAEIVRQGKERIAAAEAQPRAPIDTVARRLPPGGAYAGRDSCTGCHAEQDAQWRTTAHSHAWTTLDAAGRGLDRSCVGCHVTGWEQAGGPNAPALIGAFRDVQCETCHGPAAAHVAAPREQQPVRSPGVEVCQQCHDGERDGGRFDASSYLPRVAH